MHLNFQKWAKKIQKSENDPPPTIRYTRVLASCTILGIFFESINNIDTSEVDSFIYKNLRCHLEVFIKWWLIHKLLGRVLWKVLDPLLVENLNFNALHVTNIAQFGTPDICKCVQLGQFQVSNLIPLVLKLKKRIHIYSISTFVR